ncbi:MAG: ABC1 kinase family protein, partial [Spirochaetota bacterium]
VLTMEYIEGTPMSAFLNDESLDAHEATTIAELGADLTLKQIFVHGFFHADPHPGNILVLEDGRICYLDFGLTGNLIQRDLEVVSDILINIISRNEQKAARAVVQLAGSRDFERAKNIEREIAELIDRFQSSEAGDFSFTALLSDLIGVLVDEGLTLPPDLFLLVKSLITIEGVATGLDSTFNFTAHLEPFAETLLKERFGPKRIKARLATVAGDYSEMLEGLPGDYYRVVETLASGRVRFSLEDPSVRSLQSTVLRASSALVSAIVVGALIIGSALIVHSGVPPLWNGVPIIGIVGFLVAGLVGFGLLVSTLRKSGG